VGSHPEHDDETEPPYRLRVRLVAAAAIAAVVVFVIVLHLTGVIGPGSH
jgi:hypothetical protein